MKFFRHLKGNYYCIVTYRLLLTFTLFSVSRALFFFFNRSSFQGLTTSDWISILEGGIVFDIAGLLYFNLLFILFSLIPFPRRDRPGYQQFLKILFILSNTAALLLNCVDFIYYRFTLRRTTYAVFTEFSNETNRLKFILQFLSDYWYVTFVFVTLVYFLNKAYNYAVVEPQNPQKKVVFYGSSVLTLIVALLFSIAGIRGGYRHSTRPLAMTDAGQYVNRPNDMNLVLNTPFCFARTIGKANLREVHYFPENEVENIFTPVHSEISRKSFTPRNVVIIILESFGKEAVGFYNKHLESGTYTGYTPFLDSLLSVGKVYQSAYANGHKSIDALPAILASIPSGPQPFVLTPYTTNKLIGLPRILGSKGYETSFFHGAPNGSMGFSSFTKLAGIEKYYGKNEFNNDAEFDGMWGIWDEPFFGYFAEKLNTFRQPFLSAIFSISSHHPFKVPAHYKDTFKKGPLPVMECIGYTDMALRRFFEKASKSAWFNNTLFVITADHATVTYHPEYKTAWGDMAIPILFYAPGDPLLRGSEGGVVQQMDIMPTILGYLNYDKPYLAFGEDVRSPSRRDFAYNYQSGHRWIQGNYLLFFDGEKSTGLYEYKTDRLFRNNLLQKEPDRVQEMEKQVKAFIQQYNYRLIHDKLTAN